MNQSTRPRDERAAFRSAQAERMKLYPTQAERAVWIVLAPLGFERQVSIESGRRGRGYILDFFHREAKLNIEIDGGYHGRQRGRDGRRDRDLRMLGITTVRLTNAAVLGVADAEELVSLIIVAVERLKRGAAAEIGHFGKEPI